jgi:formylglycine-generating enzyme required for sulfatase activity
MENSAEPGRTMPVDPGELVTAAASAAGVPSHIGRYRVQATLGEGGFGRVYLAFDEQLQRLVAIKVPHRQLVPGPEAAEFYLAEARAAACLDHPNIVPVYDFGGTPDHPCFIVSKFIEGQTLARQMRAQWPSFAEAARLVATVAEALHHAHLRGIVHRDVKPGNILLDTAGRPHMADFGVALREANFGTGPCNPGTPAYMSPEQARGEGHRVDGRSDIFSLAVVLYELLTRRRPFRASTMEEMLRQVAEAEPRPPRQLDDTIPRELERICLKALARRASERYTTAHDLADDLEHFLASASVPRRLDPLAARVQGISGTPSDAAGSRAWLAGTTGHPPPEGVTLRVVPRGLRPFGAADADFFLDLLPGPRNRHGLPDSIAFWKTRLEETDPDRTFSVGVIYGPSGCGKTSLVRAGLLPRLAGEILVIYVEATPDDLEARLLKQLCKRCPNLPADCGLVGALKALRSAQGVSAGRKVVLVIDQFEQWLHGHRDEAESALVRALRHCDGRLVQCMLMVRDDFWMAISRFMHDLEVPLREGENSAAVDRFSRRHARKVLAAFGQAFGALPEQCGDLTPEQGQFLDRAVAELAQEEKVIPVRLTLFAEMIKARAWTLETLRSLGGITGTGVTFLEETFSSASAPPGHRLHQRAARLVLSALLPDEGTDLKGYRRSYQELLAASGYSHRLTEFDELLRILDTELRLVTPIEVEAVPTADGEGSHAAVGGRFYQLTHDYLVPSLREWLRHKQKESWRGRAEQQLEERVAQWGRSHDARFLPSLPEYLRICLGVPKACRKPEQQALLRAAGRSHALYWGGICTLLLLACLAAYSYLGSLHRTAQEERARDLVEAALRVPSDEVARAIEPLQPLRELAVPLLRGSYEDPEIKPGHRLRAAIVLAALGDVEEDFLVESFRTAPVGERRNLLTALRPVATSATEKLKDRFGQEQRGRMWVRWATALLYLGDARAAQEVLASGPDPTDRVRFIQEFAAWRGDLSGLPALLRGTPDAGFRSGLCAALGSVDPDPLAEDVQQCLHEVLAELYRGAADGSTHSAAGWALRQWKRELPAVAPAERPGPGMHWFANRQGMTMIEIPPGEFVAGDSSLPPWADIILAVHPRLLEAVKPHPVTLTHPFFLCDREVSMDLYRQFMEDPTWPAANRPATWKPDPAISPSGDCPAHMVSWLDALQFCNWLSQREGRQPCYERAGRRWKVKEAGDGPDAAPGISFEVEAWRCRFEADGYRLPTEAEWEYACRARTTTWWSIGDEDGLLAPYAVYQQLHAAPCGSKMPNAWGLFDMQGNMREWCWDSYAPHSDKPATDPQGPEPNPYGDRVHRGGSWYDVSAACRSGFRNRSPLVLRDRVIGFRVACGGTRPGT